MSGGRGAAPGPMRLGVLGDPLAHTLSPVLHRAGLEALGLAGESEALRTPVESLGGRLRELEARGVRGVNLTHPLKEAVLGHLARVSEAARLARSVNTVTLEPGAWAGETTDGAGFLDLLLALGRDVRFERVLLLGAGGAARSLALALLGAGAKVWASARRKDASGVPGIAFVGWRSGEERTVLGEATLIVNATPVAGEEGAIAVAWLPRRALVMDLVYGERGPTAWVRSARARGLEAHDGLGLLVFQARRSLSIWTGRDVPLEPLARAVGWPR